MRTNAPDRAYGTSYVPAVDDILMSTPPPPPPPPTIDFVPRDNDWGLGRVVTGANVLVTAIIIVGMWIDSRQVAKAIISGAAYFGLTTPIYVGLITGSLAAMLATWQRERTERHRIDAYADLAELGLRHRLRAERTRQLELRQRAAPLALPTTADPPQTPDQVDTFVPPYRDGEDRVRAEALAWVNGLYQADGTPDPDQVVVDGNLPGWLRIRMLGSKRGSGSREAGIWLLQHDVVRKAPGGYQLNVRRYPYRSELRHLLE